MAEEEVDLVLSEAAEAMEKSIHSLRVDMQKIRTGRANPAVLDGVQVDYYGTPTPLNQLANLSAPEPNLIIISPYDRAVLGDIERAIQAADLGLSPNNDGKLVRIPIPPLTEERRKELVKQLKKQAEGHKIGIREARRAALAALKDFENDGSLPADSRHRADKAVQDLTDSHTKQVDVVTGQKEEEILQV